MNIGVSDALTPSTLASAIAVPVRVSSGPVDGPDAASPLSIVMAVTLKSRAASRSEPLPRLPAPSSLSTIPPQSPRLPVHDGVKTDGQEKTLPAVALPAPLMSLRLVNSLAPASSAFNVPPFKVIGPPRLLTTSFALTFRVLGPSMVTEPSSM